MSSLIVLGSAAAVPDANHDNTHFLLRGDGSNILVDCGSNPLVKLRGYGLKPDDLSDMILTHFHPDHVAGVSNFLMQLWLLRRKAPLQVHGLHHCMLRTAQMMDAFLWDTWPYFFPVEFHDLAERSAVTVLDNDDFRIIAWPTVHFIPTIGLRIEDKHSGQVIAYSGDTEPAGTIIELARGADVLLHEAAGRKPGHSSAAQAGETAAEAGVKRLILIHYEVWNSDPSGLAAEARATFSGPVEIAQDGSCYEF